ncbi:MAG: hypothetical protein JWM40_529, partial [Frankiales bacterium]|nr:hypothetical protein [Frankiales bacterium]
QDEDETDTDAEAEGRDHTGEGSQTGHQGQDAPEEGRTREVAGRA